MLRTLIIAAALALVLPQTAKAAPVLDVSPSGLLLGATGVDVGGTLFDVQFRGGTCIDRFSGCDNAADDFAFTTEADAVVAASALLDSVLLDGPLGDFDSNAALTNGCGAFCSIFVPFATDGIEFTAIVAFNDDDEANDEVRPPSSLPIDLNLGPIDVATFAVFTPSQAVNVPAPASLGLLVVGLVGLGLARRRRG